MSSSQYKDGQFLLLLDNPVTGGSYTCNVSQTHASSGCPHGSGAYSGDASVTVDKVEARLSLLEAENEKLKERLAQRGQDYDRQMARLQNLVNQTSSSVDQLSRNISSFKQEVYELGVLLHHWLNG